MGASLKHTVLNCRVKAQSWSLLYPTTTLYIGPAVHVNSDVRLCLTTPYNALYCASWLDP